jgi:UDP-N-acetylglucosamine 2-epimerase (non-hydrolysing)
MAPAVPLRASVIADGALPSPARRWAPLHALGGPSAQRANLLVVAGTRPECIKLAPLMHALRGHPDFAATLINAGQHRDAVHRCLAEFGLRADIELPAMKPAPHMAAAHAALKQALTGALRTDETATVVVQGDTLTAYSAARAAFAVGHRVAHIEAGLRTDDAMEPFPEEWFRRRIARYADLHFAPSRSAVENLLGEGIDERCIHHVGNTGIDSLHRVLRESSSGRRERRARNTVLVTLHRRSNYDRNCAIVCTALLALATQRPELRFLFPVHPNPRVSAQVRRLLGTHPRFHLVEPMAYHHFIECAARAALIVSDSGGIQEEAAHLGTPLLVPRTNTERPECLATGFVRLVAVEHGALLEAAHHALDAPRQAPLAIDEQAPFGAGDAAARIVGVLESIAARRAYA